MKDQVAIVGGGISGLAAAWELHKKQIPYQIYESTNLWGGKIQSSMVGDRLVDAGPDSFLARSKTTVELCNELGLENDLVTPGAAKPPLIYRDGNLHVYPKNTFLGVPLNIETLKSSNIVSNEAIQLALAEPTMPAIELGEEISIGELCRTRLGDEITDYLIDPLLGGINASGVDQLSLQSAAPAFFQAAKSGSLITGLQKIKEQRQLLANGKPQKIFFGLKNGIASLVNALVNNLDSDSMNLETTVDSTIFTNHKSIIFCTPAFATSKIIHSALPKISDLIKNIEYASVAQATLEFNTKDIPNLPDSSGIIFPKVENKLISACTIFSSKWDHYKRPEKTLIRLTTGKYRNDSHTLNYSDEQLIAVLLEELKEVVEIKAAPINVRVQRWPNSLPQYFVGHSNMAAKLEEAIQQESAPIRLAGAAYHGIGIPACIESGQRAAQEIADQFLGDLYSL